MMDYRLRRCSLGPCPSVAAKPRPCASVLLQAQRRPRL